MAVAAPVIKAEMDDWVALGGRNSGIVGNDEHDSGFHRAANEVPSTDYSRRRDPNGSDGPYVNWSYACAGDFWHGDDPRLLAYHRRLLARLEAGDPSLSMICEFIGQPWPDRPVLYWSRWGGRSTYRGAGHGTWTHIAWYRSRANQRAHLWKDDDMPLTNADKALVRDAVLEALQTKLPLPSPIDERMAKLGSSYGPSIAPWTLLARVFEPAARQSRAGTPVADVDEHQLATELAGPLTAALQPLLSTLTPEAIAAAIPPELAGQVADELAARLQG
jgi:hypothetical protein